MDLILKWHYTVCCSNLVSRSGFVILHLYRLHPNLRICKDAFPTKFIQLNEAVYRTGNLETSCTVQWYGSYQQIKMNVEASKTIFSSTIFVINKKRLLYLTHGPTNATATTRHQRQFSGQCHFIWQERHCCESGMFIPNPNFSHSGSRIQGSKGTGSRIRISNTGKRFSLQATFLCIKKNHRKITYKRKWSLW